MLPCLPTTNRPKTGCCLEASLKAALGSVHQQERGICLGCPCWSAYDSFQSFRRHNVNRGEIHEVGQSYFH